MKTDLTGGLDDERDYLLAEAPTTPNLREAVNIWAWSDDGEIGLPRVAIDAIAPDWSTFNVFHNMTFPDGRTLQYLADDESLPTIGPKGVPTILGAGPLKFETITPFGAFHASFDGEVTDSRFNDMAKGEPGTRKTRLQWEITYEPSVPPWIQGTMNAEAKALLTSDTFESRSMGGERFEQLCRAHGVVRLDGVERKFNGGALRIRRRGVRNEAGFKGHNWQSAQFPSGRAFGCNAFPPPPDGPTYNEGYLFMGEGDLIPAKIVEAPWLSKLQSSGDDVSVVLESELGLTHIEGVGVSSIPLIGMTLKQGHSFPPLVEGIARYRWDGEEGYGMIERSNLPERVSRL